MTGTIIYQPPEQPVKPRHRCAYPRPALYPQGTVWRCDECRRRWRRGLVRSMVGDDSPYLHEGFVPAWLRRYWPWPR